MNQCKIFMYRYYVIYVFIYRHYLEVITTEGEIFRIDNAVWADISRDAQDLLKMEFEILCVGINIKEMKKKENKNGD